MAVAFAPQVLQVDLAMCKTIATRHAVRRLNLVGATSAFVVYNDDRFWAILPVHQTRTHTFLLRVHTPYETSAYERLFFYHVAPSIRSALWSKAPVSFRILPSRDLKLLLANVT